MSDAKPSRRGSKRSGTTLDRSASSVGLAGKALMLPINLLTRGLEPETLRLDALEESILAITLTCIVTPPQAGYLVLGGWVISDEKTISGEMRTRFQGRLAALVGRAVSEKTDQCLPENEPLYYTDYGKYWIAVFVDVDLQSALKRAKTYSNQIRLLSIKSNVKQECGPKAGAPPPRRPEDRSGDAPGRIDPEITQLRGLLATPRLRAMAKGLIADAERDVDARREGPDADPAETSEGSVEVFADIGLPAVPTDQAGPWVATSDLDANPQVRSDAREKRLALIIAHVQEALEDDPSDTTRLFRLILGVASLEARDRFLKSLLSELLTSEQAAEQIGLSRVWVKKLAQQGDLGTKLGRDYLFTAQEVAAYREKERRPGPRYRSEDTD